MCLARRILTSSVNAERFRCHCADVVSEKNHDKGHIIELDGASRGISCIIRLAHNILSHGLGRNEGQFRNNDQFYLDVNIGQVGEGDGLVDEHVTLPTKGKVRLLAAS